MSQLTEKLCSVEQTDYGEVTHIDKMLRDFKYHPYAMSQYPKISWAVGPPLLDKLFKHARPFIHPLVSVIWREQGKSRISQGLIVD